MEFAVHPLIEGVRRLIADAHVPVADVLRGVLFRDAENGVVHVNPRGFRAGDLRRTESRIEARPHQRREFLATDAVPIVDAHQLDGEFLPLGHVGLQSLAAFLLTLDRLVRGYLSELKRRLPEFLPLGDGEVVLRLLSVPGGERAVGFPFVLVVLVVSPLEVAFQGVQAGMFVGVGGVGVGHRLDEVVRLIGTQDGHVLVLLFPHVAFTEADAVEGSLGCSLRVSHCVARVFAFEEEPLGELLAAVLVVEQFLLGEHPLVVLGNEQECDFHGAPFSKAGCGKWII